MKIIEIMKKNYIAPETEIINLSIGSSVLQDKLMNTFSGGGGDGEPTIDPNPDNNDEEPNMSNQFSNNLWDHF